MSKIDTLKAISLFSVLYKQDMTEKRLKMYCTLLEDIDTNTLTLAVFELCKTSKWLPSVAEIRDECRHISDFIADNRDKYIAPIEAWDKTIQAVKHWGYDRGLSHLEGRIKAAAVPLWRDICFSDEGRQDILRAHYIKLYEQIQVREDKEARIGKAIEKVPAMKAAHAKAIEAHKPVQQLIESVAEVTEMDKKLAEVKISDKDLAVYTSKINKIAPNGEEK